MTFEEKSKLIRSDPVTCARYFDHRLRLLKSCYLTPQNGLFQSNNLSDFFWRIEFQHRGSPHMHGLFWLDNVPKFDENNIESYQKCCDFIDSFITTKADDPDIKHQKHKHTKCCQRTFKGETSCRFGIPYPPMPKTEILLPFPTSVPKSVVSSHFAKLQEIKKYIEDLEDTSLTYEEFLANIGIDHDKYISAVRSGIKRPTVFLKREANACFINAYNPILAKIWNANIDFQFILDPYACAKYVCTYISKSVGGVSKLLKNAAESIKNGNFDLKEKLRKFGNTFLNGMEICCQEAVYNMLGIPSTMSSRDVVFIPTGLPEERVKMLKSKSELSKLPSDSKDVTKLGLLEHYSSRPDCFEKLSLADFASLFEFSKTCSINPLQENEDDVSNEETENINWFKLIDNSGWIRRRRQRKVIRFRNYGEILDPENFYREQVFLFYPWRNEAKDILNKNVKDVYNNEILKINENRSIYFKCNFDEDLVNDSIPENSSTPAIDEEFKVLDTSDPNGDILLNDINTNQNKNSAERFKITNMMSSSEYGELLRKANVKQKCFANHVIEKIIKKDVFQEILTGGAGVGKSVAVTIITQMVLRYCNSIPGNDPTTLKVALGAPTGKAAFLIDGDTVHHLFSLPLNQYVGNLPALSSDYCNKIRSAMRDLKLVIIDEFSMLSRNQLYYINTRLQQIFCSTEPFGGISIILVGGKQKFTFIKTK